MLAIRHLPHRTILRLRPDYPSSAPCVIGPDSRFGIPFDELTSCREVLAARGQRATGFHVFSGSQMSDATEVVHHLHRATDLSLRAADALQVTPQIVNLGGGFGIAYKAGQQDLDLVRIGEELV